MDLLEREQELIQIADAFARARTGDGSMLLVAGEAGAGKSTLVRAAAAALGRDALVLEGACDPLSTPRPLSPLLDLASDPESGLGDLLDNVGAVDMFGVVLDRLRESIRPVLLIIEDIHWADEGTLDFVRFVGRRVADSRSAVICTYRDDEIDPDHQLRPLLGQLARLETTEQITVPTLSEAAVEALAAGHNLDGRALHDLTGGNAFFVTEVIAAGREMPRTVQDAVLARVSDLSAPARKVVEAVSLAPRSLDIAFVEPLSGAKAADADEAVLSGFIIAEQSQLRFRHELARLAVEASLPPARRIEQHRRMLALLDESGSQDLARLAHHAIQVGDDRLIQQYAPVAAAQAASRGSNKESVALYTAVLETTSLDEEVRAELNLAVGINRGRTGQIEESFANGLSAVDYYRKVGSTRRLGNALVELSRMQWRLPDPAGATATISEGVALLRELGPSRDLASGLYNLAYTAMLARQGEAATTAAADALALAEDLGAVDVAVRAKLMLGCAEIATGDGRLGIGQLEAVLGEFRELDDQAGVVDTLGMIGTGGGEARVYDAAIPALEERIVRGIAADEDFTIEYMRAWQARIAFEQGRWGESVDIAEKVLAGAAVGHGIGPVTALGALGRVRVRRGDPGGRALLEQAVDGSSYELQHVWSPVSGIAEAAWLGGPTVTLPDVVAETYQRALGADSAWARGEVGFWMWRTGQIDAPPPHAAEPYALQISGDWRGAATAWRQIGCPYEVAMALADGDDTAMTEGLAMFDELGAAPAARWLRSRMRQAGVDHIPRGPTNQTKSNPAGLTGRQLDVLRLMVAGQSNSEIAEQLFVSKKTVEHHVSAIYGKLEVESRAKAIAAAGELSIQI